MDFGTIIWNQNIDRKQNYATWIQIALQSTEKQKIYTQTLQDVETRHDTSNYELELRLPI